jgi:hypothetical protein
MRFQAQRELIRMYYEEECLPSDRVQIERVESRLGRRIPEPLVDWLLTCNGSSGGRGGIVGVEQRFRSIDMETLLSSFPEWNELGWFPVALDGCGNYYVMVRDAAVDGGFPICFVDSYVGMSTLVYTVASNIEAFLHLMLEQVVRNEDGWPFDKKWVTQYDPNILEVSVAPLPWAL